MKKLLFTLLSAVTLFSSCSSDNDAFIDNGLNNNTTEKKYTVNFDIKSAGFDVDKAPMRDAKANDQKIFQYVVYNEDGTVYSDSVYQDDQVSLLFGPEGNIPVTLELPEGNYHIAILYLPSYIASPFGTSYYIIKAENFDTDYYSQSNPSSSRFYITDVYYEVIDIQVSENSINNTLAIQLMPMWSEVVLNLKGISKAKKPIGTEYIRVLYNPYNYGFSIKTKLATYESPSGMTGSELGSYTAKVDADSAIFSYYPTKSEDNSMGLTVEYLRADNHSRWYTLASQEIKFENKFENGNRYTISGDLINAENTGDNQIAITYQPIHEEHVVLPFE